MLYCPNPNCQALNSESDQNCQVCSTPLPHRYLWAVGEGAAASQPGDLVADRYSCKQRRIFLDTRPGLLSNTYREIPEAFLPYLRLTAHSLHVPQVYDWVPAESGGELVLLDHVPLYGVHARQDLAQSPTQSAAAQEVQLLPSLESQWGHASPLRQLNWLWQMANLWQPLTSESAAISMFDLDLLRTEGTLLRFLELRFETQPTLADLGQLWLGWAKTAQSEISGFLTQLSQGLIQGQIHNAELLVGYLDAALARLNQSRMRQIRLATLSDQGPTRQRNEDACYPASGTQSPPFADQSLVIVCDGIGGHQGGDVASHLAIATLEHHVKALQIDQLDSTTLAVELEKAVCAANDQISQRNDSEHRFDRQRMGTTVVMALMRGHELYITHVGDSRAYWITRWGCHQITLDDDVASREVRLGYSFHRQALHQPSSGSLVQALGMGASTLLYPSVQRFIPDEDCVLLLCSDGLSDNDRVEEHWESKILPLLDGTVDLATVAQQLVEIGNQQNGYDNVTVGLIHHQVKTTEPIPVLTDLPQIDLPATRLTSPLAPLTDEEKQTELIAPSAAELVTAPPALPTLTQPQPPSAKARFVPFLIGIGLLCAVGGLLVALLPSLQPERQPEPGTVRLSPTPSSPSVANPPATQTDGLNAVETPLLEVGSFIQLNQSTQPDRTAPVLIAQPPQQPSPPTSTAPATPSPAETSPVQTVGFVPVGTVLEVLEKRSLTQQESWVNLRVCSTPAGNSPEIASPSAPLTVAPAEAPAEAPATVSPISPSPAESPDAVPLAQVGQMGWIQEDKLLNQVTTKMALTPEQQQACAKQSP
jgi:protein phosphatase